MELLIVGIDDMCPFRMLSGDYWRSIVNLNVRWGIMHSRGAPGCPRDPDPHSGPCWLSIYTGLEPEEHGVLMGGWSPEHGNYGSLTVPTMWDKLAEKYRVGMMTMPVTWPVPRLPEDSWAVSPKDWGGPVCWPPALLDGVDVAWRGTRFNSRDECRFNAKAREEKIEIEWNRVKMIERLPEVDVLAFGTEAAGMFCHHVLKGEDPINAEVFGALGDMVAYLRGKYKPKRVAIFSDHGFAWRGTVHGKTGVYFLIGDWEYMGMPPGVLNLTEMAPIILERMGCGTIPERIPVWEDSSKG